MKNIKFILLTFMFITSGAPNTRAAEDAQADKQAAWNKLPEAEKASVLANYEKWKGMDAVKKTEIKNLTFKIILFGLVGY